jgi:pimeloyl-ACP methyl ester carboxylesterase
MKKIGLVLILTMLIGCGGAKEPGTAKARRIDDGRVPSADGTTIAYSLDGRGDTALVFIHCWACDRGFWSDQIEPFTSDHEVVTIDLAGHGDSGTDRAEWTLASLANDVRAVADELDLQRMVLIGHSMGGPVALMAAPLMPGRVLGVIGVDTLHNADEEFDMEAFLRAFEEDFAGACDRFVRGTFGSQADPELISRTAADMCAIDPEIGIELMRQFPDLDLAATLQRAGVPVRCVNAASYPTNIEGNRKYADFDAVIMEGVGHFPMFEQPDEFNLLLAQTIEEITAEGDS